MREIKLVREGDGYEQELAIDVTEEWGSDPPVWNVRACVRDGKSPTPVLELVPGGTSEKACGKPFAAVVAKFRKQGRGRRPAGGWRGHASRRASPRCGGPRATARPT